MAHFSTTFEAAPFLACFARSGVFQTGGIIYAARTFSANLRLLHDSILPKANAQSKVR
jgi:hypothetical protein